MSQPAPQPQPSRTQPAPQTPGTAAPAYPYASYPYYGYPYYAYPYPYPAATPGSKPPALPRSPSEGPGRPWAARVRNLVLAVVAIILTVAAIAAAASSAVGAQSAPTPASQGLRQIYGQSLVNDSTSWTLDQGCVLQDGGLLADGTSAAVATDLAVCKFIPSTQQDLLSQGFQATLVMAPSGDVPTLEQGGIALGTGDGTYLFDMSQQGEFEFGEASGQTAPVTGSTIAWHTDPSIANTITLDYSAASSLLQIYVNGQLVLTESATLVNNSDLSLFGSSGDQALFTSFSLFSATPAQANASQRLVARTAQHHAVGAHTSAPAISGS